MIKGIPRRMVTLLLALLLLILVFILSHCKAPTVITNTDTDSVVIVERLRVDTLRIPGEALINVMRIECDSATNLPKPAKSGKRGLKSSVSATIDATGILTTESRCDSLEAQVVIRDREIRRLHSRATTIVKPPVYLTRTVDFVCRTFTAACLLALGALAFLKWRRLI